MASNANLGQHLEDYVTDLVKNGRYNSRSEVLREGVRMIEDREKRLAALDLSIAHGLADVEAGRVKPARTCSHASSPNMKVGRKTTIRDRRFHQLNRGGYPAYRGLYFSR